VARHVSRYNRIKSIPIRFRHIAFSCIALFIAITLLLLFHSKSPKTTCGFYYWKTSVRLSEIEKTALHILDAKTIYIRYFDVTWDHASNKAYPVGEISGYDSIFAALNLVPVIYIENEVFKHENNWIRDSLSILMMKKIAAISKKWHCRYREIQFDCDWTESTKERYFRFLRNVKTNADDTLRISATIRLHQVKYTKRMGIVPADRAMIMLYNMKSPSLDTICSIYDKQTAMRYLPYLKKYPLPYDIALPIFSWGIHGRGGTVIGVYGKITAAMMESRNYFLRLSGGYFQAKANHYSDGVYFMAQDIVKIEETDAHTCAGAYRDARRYLGQKNMTIAFFDLDSVNLQRIQSDELKSIFSHCW
jgi:hypothetical protein